MPTQNPNWAQLSISTPNWRKKDVTQNLLMDLKFSWRLCRLATGACVHVCMRACVCTYVCVHVCACVFVRVSVGECLCACVHTCVHACVTCLYPGAVIHFFPKNQLHSQNALVYGEQQLDSMRRNGWLPIFDSYNKDRPGYQVRA